MKITAIRSLAVIGLMLAASFTATWRTLTDGAAIVVQTYRKAKAWVFATVAEGLELAANKPSVRMPAVRLVQARSFYTRLMRRDRPVMTDGWRMCPSI